MKVNFVRKPTPSEICPRDEFIIEKVIRLSKAEFEDLLKEPLKDRDYVRENKDKMYEDTDGFMHRIYVVSDYGYTRTRRRGIENVSTEIMLNALGMNIAKLFRFYTTNKLDNYWTAPSDLEKENIKSPSMKRLAKKGKRINLEIYKNDK